LGDNLRFIVVDVHPKSRAEKVRKLAGCGIALTEVG
jgi:hypothetical protein